MGWLDELAGTDAELAGSTVELVGSAAELLDSSADEMASMSELLTGSWLRGMELLELVGVVSADVASDWLELAGPSVRLELFGASSARLELTIVSDELMELGAGSLPCSELAEVESSQAFNVNAAAMPKVAAMALLAAAGNGFAPKTFNFSIFIERPPYRTKDICFWNSRL